MTAKRLEAWRVAVIGQAHPTGVELTADFSKDTAISAQGGAEGGAQSSVSDPDLARLINRWPTLPAEVRKQIVELLRASPKADS